MEVKFRTCLAISWFLDSMSKRRFAELEEMETTLSDLIKI